MYIYWNLNYRLFSKISINDVSKLLEIFFNRYQTVFIQVDTSSVEITQTKFNYEMSKILLTLCKKSAIIGIKPHQHPINVQSLPLLFIDGLNIASSGVYFFSEPESFQEYAESIFLQTIFLAATSGFVVTLLQMQQIFDWIEDVEQLIDGSEFKILL